MGSKVTEVAEKVATDTVEDLRKAAGFFEEEIPGEHTHTHTLSLSFKRLYGVSHITPDLVLLSEPEPPPRPPTPSSEFLNQFQSLPLSPLSRLSMKAKSLSLSLHNKTAQNTLSL